MKNIVLIPVETLSRELDYKLVLAHRLANHDTVCIVGQHNYLNKIFKFFNGGVYFGKNVFPDMVPSTQEHFLKLKENDFSLLYHHEEGGVFFGNELDWVNKLKSQLDPSSLREDDAILCWGKFQEDFYNSLGMPFKTYNIGCPRLDIEPNTDLYAISKENKHIKEEGYILINTNFALVNHMMGITSELKYLQSREYEDNNALHNINLWYSEVFEIMGSFLKLIILLLKQNPSQKFILRPHPTESLKIYEYLQSTYPNLEVSKSYNAPNWISKCKLVIQNNCTTSLEAYFMGVPVVNYLQHQNIFSVNILDDIGYCINNVNDLNNLIQSKNIDVSNKINDQSKLKLLFNNFTTEGSSIDNIVVCIQDHLKLKKKSRIPLTKLKLIYFLAKLRNAIFYIPRYFFSSKLKAYKMHRSHFQGFKKNDLVQKIDLLDKRNNKSTKIEFLNSELFIITD